MNSWKAKTVSHPPHLYNLNTQQGTWHVVVSKCRRVSSPIPLSNCSKSLPFSSNPLPNLWHFHLNCQQMTSPERVRHPWNPLTSCPCHTPCTSRTHFMHIHPNFPPCLCWQRKTCPSSSSRPILSLCFRPPLISSVLPQSSFSPFPPVFIQQIFTEQLCALGCWEYNGECVS